MFNSAIFGDKLLTPQDTIAQGEAEGRCPECNMPIAVVHEGKNGRPAHFGHKPQTESQRVRALSPIHTEPLYQ